MTFTAEQKQKAIKRELGFRRRVFRRHVEVGKMTAADAEFEIAIFEAIEADYRAKAEAEQRAGELAL